MTGNGKETIEERLELQSQLSDLARVPDWVGRLASQYFISSSLQFSINLCLEEVLSNIVRHGYSSESDRSITLRFANPKENYFVFIVEDHAPPFDPVNSPELPPLCPPDLGRVGGQGIRLLRQFADALEYETLPDGNRLRIGFSAAHVDIESGNRL
ncbi:MAG TPA: ATP-binding protein [Candidatus Acidoferrales bacterium]